MLPKLYRSLDILTTSSSSLSVLKGGNVIRFLLPIFIPLQLRLPFISITFVGLEL